jgi:hypothetical protein
VDVYERVEVSKVREKGVYIVCVGYRRREGSILECD